MVVKDTIAIPKSVIKAPVVEKPLAEESIELKIPVNKNICVVPISHIDPKPKIEKIVNVPDKVSVRYGFPQYRFDVISGENTLFIRSLHIEIRNKKQFQNILKLEKKVNWTT